MAVESRAEWEEWVAAIQKVAEQTKPTHDHGDQKSTEEEDEPLAEVSDDEAAAANVPACKKPNSLKQGYMSKPGLKKKNVLHKRFFVLDQHYLHYFKADKDVTPLNSIPLEGCSVFSKSSRKLPIFHILHPNRRTFIICANSHEEKEKWVYAINCVICSLSTDAINPIKGNTSSVLTLAFVLENLLALRASSYR